MSIRYVGNGCKTGDGQTDRRFIQITFPDPCTDPIPPAARAPGLDLDLDLPDRNDDDNQTGNGANDADDADVESHQRVEGVSGGVDCTEMLTPVMMKPQAMVDIEEAAIVTTVTSVLAPQLIVLVVCIGGKCVATTEVISGVMKPSVVIRKCVGHQITVGVRYYINDFSAVFSFKANPVMYNTVG